MGIWVHDGVSAAGWSSTLPFWGPKRRRSAAAAGSSTKCVNTPPHATQETPSSAGYSNKMKVENGTPSTMAAGGV